MNYAPYDIITLTPKGKKLAAEIVRRHEALKEFFIKILLIDKDEAEEASCKVEHAVSKNIIDRLIHFVEFMEICPRGGKEWLKGFRRHCENGDTANRCGDYIEACLEDLRKRAAPNLIPTQNFLKSIAKKPESRTRTSTRTSKRLFNVLPIRTRRRPRPRYPALLIDDCFHPRKYCRLH